MSAIGKLHIHESRHRDDAFHLRGAGDWLAAAVSDGAGSRPLSRLGATFSAEFLTRHLIQGAQRGLLLATREPPSEFVSRLQRVTDVGSVPDIVVDITDGQLHDLMRYAFVETREALVRFAKTYCGAANQLHCTLLGMALNSRTGAFVVGRVGDGLVAGVPVGAAAKAREFAEFKDPGDVGETVFLTQEGWQEALKIDDGNAKGFSGLFLMTDGVSEDISHPPPEGILTRALTDMDRQLRSDASLDEIAAAFLKWLESYEHAGSWDDRTLVAVWNTETPSESVAG